jgi:hypothetical protein
MVENPAPSYGLFHAVANPIYSWGVIRQVKFPGLNMDIGHIRNLTWSKTNSQAEWVNYNRMRGQYMSALEHAVPEKFFNDPSQCNLEGATSPNSALPACPQGISAVKAIALAGAAGQRIYTITPQVYSGNANIVQTQLAAHSASTRSKVQQALDAGFEVTIHQAPITQSGWTGAGYTLIDSSTGAGGYLIESGASGGLILLAGIVVAALFFFQVLAIAVATSLLAPAVAAAAGIAAPYLLDYIGVPDVLALVILRGLVAVMVLGAFGGFLPALGLLGLLVQGLISVFTLLWSLDKVPR